MWTLIGLVLLLRHLLRRLARLLVHEVVLFLRLADHIAIEIERVVCVKLVDYGVLISAQIDIAICTEKHGRSHRAARLEAHRKANVAGSLHALRHHSALRMQLRQLAELVGCRLDLVHWPASAAHHALETHLLGLRAEAHLGRVELAFGRGVALDARAAVAAGALRRDSRTIRTSQSLIKLGYAHIAADDI